MNHWTTDKNYRTNVWKKKYIFVGILTCFFAIILPITFSKGEKVQNGSYVASAGNKSLSRENIYIEEDKINEDYKVFSLSFDDVINCFKDLNENQDIYDSIFQNDTFSWFKDLNDKYNVVITCFVFFEDDDFNLEICTDKFRKEFENNSNWLRFGFHALNSETIYGDSKLANDNEQLKILYDYNKTVTALKKVVGGNSIDHVIRLQSFQGAEDEIKALVRCTNEPIIDLLTADDLRNSYYLSPKDNEYIYSHDVMKDRENNLILYSTDLRLEFIDNINEKINEFTTDSWNNQTRYLVVFSHEWKISEVQNKTEEICLYAKMHDYNFTFLEDIEQP